MGEITNTGIEESVPRQLQDSGDQLSLYDIGELLRTVSKGKYNQAIDAIKKEQPNLAYAFLATPRTQLVDIWNSNRYVFNNGQPLKIWSSVFKFERIGQRHWPITESGLDYAGNVVMRSLISALSETDSGALNNDSLLSILGEKALHLVEHNVPGAKIYGEQIVAVASSQPEDDATIVEDIVMKAIRIAQERDLELPPMLPLFESDFSRF